MEGFQLLRPLWLLAILPLAGALILLFRSGPTDSTWKKLVDSHLLPHLLVNGGNDRRRWRLVVTGAAWSIAVLALTGPSWQRMPPLDFKPRVPPLVILLDLSRSMNTRDLAPSRIEVARVKLRTLVSRLSQRPVSLVVYALTAHSVMPLTEDRGLISEALGTVNPEMMPAQGSRASAALSLAAETLQRYGATRGDLLLVTDAADREAAAQGGVLADKGIHLSVWGMGTVEGGFVPDGERGYLIDESGAVRSTLETGYLQSLAETGGGRFQAVSRDDSDIEALIAGFGRPEFSDIVETEGSGEIWLDGGPWLLLALLPAALLLFRPGALPLILVAAGLSNMPAEAAEWSWLWQNQNQRALHALEQQAYARAAEEFSDPLWKGIAQYRSGQYLQAAHTFARLDSAIASYNRGNALTRLGRYGEALEAYDQALALDSAMSDAAFNRQLAMRLITQADAEAGPAAAPGEQRKPGPRENPATPSLTAEELLDAPKPGDYRQLAGASPPELEQAGRSGGGAMLHPGGEHDPSRESSSVGEGLDGGDAEERPEDEVARRGAGGEATQDPVEKRISPSHPLPGESGEQDDTREKSPKTDPLETASAENPSQMNSLTSEISGVEEALPQQQAGTDNREISGEDGVLSPGTETYQAMSIWLDGIEENPGALLKEQFRREFQRRPPATDLEKPW